MVSRRTVPKIQGLASHHAEQALIFSFGNKKVGQKFGNNEISSYLCNVKRGIRRKDDNLYDLQRSFRAPSITSHHSPEWWLCCLLRLLGNGDTILDQVLVGTLQPHHQLNLPIFHNKEFLKLLLVPRVTLGWLLGNNIYQNDKENNSKTCISRIFFVPL